ncbi:MAG: PspA/IM30 family protein [Planctomycetaceae bacterium]
MTYFSRLTDIVSCNLSDILASKENPDEALEVIIVEMREGFAGAERAVKNAKRQEERILSELETYRGELQTWLGEAKDALQAGNEEAARKALHRKQEMEDVVAGLEQQLKAAQATVKHLTTTFRAVEGRLNEALRKQAQFKGEQVPESAASSMGAPPSELVEERNKSIEDELANLKKELGM